MPRQARLDIPNVIYHVFAKSKDQKNLFDCQEDYLHFISLLKELVTEKQIRCYAWSLTPEHFYLIIYLQKAILKSTMRKLLTAYVAGYNQRHKSNDGKLFHGRYQSIICEKAPYLMSLICSTHLRPIEKGVCHRINDLNNYPWSGHLSLLNTSNPIYVIDEKGAHEAILQFSDTDIVSAKSFYLQKLETMYASKDYDYDGGGWMRSTGCNRKDIWNTTDEEIAQYDPRILGSPEFVKHVLDTASHLKNQTSSENISIHHLIDTVSKYYRISTDRLFQKCQKKDVSQARCVICHIEIDHLKRTGVLVGKMMKIQPFSAIRCAQRGKKIYDSDPSLQKLIGFPILA
jgi:REP element-mobilizing transposase RayT